MKIKQSGLINYRETLRKYLEQFVLIPTKVNKMQLTNPLDDDGNIINDSLGG